MKKLLITTLICFSATFVFAQDKQKVYYFDGVYYNECYIESTQIDNRGETVYVLNDAKGFYTIAKQSQIFEAKDIPIDGSVRGEAKHGK